MSLIFDIQHTPHQELPGGIRQCRNEQTLTALRESNTLRRNASPLSARPPQSPWPATRCGKNALWTTALAEANRPVWDQSTHSGLCTGDCQERLLSCSDGASPSYMGSTTQGTPLLPHSTGPSHSRDPLNALPPSTAIRVSKWQTATAELVLRINPRFMKTP